MNDYIDAFETEKQREERRESYLALMRIPDPPDIAGRRRYRYRMGGDKLRQPDEKVRLEAAYYQHRMAEMGRHGGGSILSVRRSGA